MYHDGTPVQDSTKKIMIRKTFSTCSVTTVQEEKNLVDGVATFDIEIGQGCTALEISVRTNSVYKHFTCMNEWWWI